MRAASEAHQERLKKVLREVRGTSGHAFGPEQEYAHTLRSSPPGNERYIRLCNRSIRDSPI